MLAALRLSLIGEGCKRAWGQELGNYHRGSKQCFPGINSEPLAPYHGALLKTEGLMPEML